MAAKLNLRFPALKYTSFLVCVQYIAFLYAPSAAAQAGPESKPSSTALVRVDTNPAHVLNSFDPDRALGSSIDVLSRTGIDKVYSPHIVQESLSEIGRAHV